MAKSGYLYRRSSGIYVVRICVPKRLQPIVGRGEIHISTGARDLSSAKLSALRSLLHWNQCVLELDGMDVLKIVEGSPLLMGDGLVRVIDAAQTFGLDLKTMLVEAANSKADLLCSADSWRGIEVSDLRDVERDFDGAYVLNDVERLGREVVVIDHVVLFDTGMAVKSFLTADEYVGEIFFRDGRRRRAVFFDPGEKVVIGSLLLRKRDAETIRLRLFAGITPLMIETAKALRQSPQAAPAAPTVATGHKHEGVRVSKLMAEFLTAKRADWKSDQYRRMSGVCGIFVELMDDPVLGDIDRQLIQLYRQRLQLLPKNLFQARHRHGVESLSELIGAAEKSGDALMSATTANSCVLKLSEMLNWAAVEGWMPRNPAAGVGNAGDRDKRAQDDRCMFDDADLAKIFGVEWFVNGTGKKSKRGDFRFFQPHFYWLPLLGLYSGGRLNELSQLYLDDVRENDDGCWYLDFNLIGADKIEADPTHESPLETDKSLKSINSQRVVTLHDTFVTLGFPLYVEALRAAGHVRLFPELRHDKVKGYGKAAGAWFNDRFLGGRLEIPRDGTKTFHSFRHTFITGVFDAEVPEATVAQLAGHERGKTMAAKRYRKDQEASKLRPYVNRLRFNLPPIAPFNVADGLLAVSGSLDRKRRHPSVKSKARVKI